MTNPTAQCESCGETYPEDSMQTETYPGATLYFCEDCSEKPYRKQVL